MKRFITTIIIIIGCLFIISGCQTDEKQIAEIQEIMKESAKFEKNFAANQKGLFDTKKDAQGIYNELISLDINSRDVINQKIEDGHTFINKQQELLKKAEENFQKACETTLSIEKIIKKIDDENHRKQATELVTTMNERKTLINAFTEDYHKNLELQNSFYQQLQDENLSIENLNKQIEEINNGNLEMGNLIQEFNQYTEQYIDVEKDFFK